LLLDFEPLLSVNSVAVYYEPAISSSSRDREKGFGANAEMKTFNHFSKSNCEPLCSFLSHAACLYLPPTTSPALGAEVEAETFGWKGEKPFYWDQEGVQMALRAQERGHFGGQHCSGSRVAASRPAGGSCLESGKQGM
jgi:hypothetical protein